jgi:hypothetical protein
VNLTSYLSFSAEIENKCNYTSTFPYAFIACKGRILSEEGCKQQLFEGDRLRECDERLGEYVARMKGKTNVRRNGTVTKEKT